MQQSDGQSMYLNIARDVAMRIAQGEIAEGARLSGRSLLGPQYGVSPETARRAIRLLSDMGIVQTEVNVGSRVISRKRAMEYVKQHDEDDEFKQLQRELESLIEERAKLDTRILSVSRRITRLATSAHRSENLRTYEFRIAADSAACGVSIGDLDFRNRTRATIVAVRRADELITSPGASLVLMGEDILIVACDIGDVEKVSDFIEGGK